MLEIEDSSVTPTTAIRQASVDPRGWVCTTATDGIHVYEPDRTQSGYIPKPAVCSTCADGGDSLRRLFIPATNLLLAIDLLG